MSVIIRLQNLPWSANSLDIRHYFKGLSIPEGGVHIVGGEMGDAFIAFSTDEDARQAMMLGGGKIKEVQISLMLSSRSEMQKVIEAARQASMTSSLAQLLAPPPASLPTIPQQQQPTFSKESKDLKGDRKDSSDLSTGTHDSGGKRDKRDRSRSRSRERNKKDRRERDRDRERERDRDRERRRRSRSRSRSRDRRRRRSRSRSRGRDSHNREKERKDGKEDLRKESEGIPMSAPDPSANLTNLDLLNPSTWNVMQTGGLTQNAQLLTNFELLRNLANQKGPLISGAPPLLPTPINTRRNEALLGNERFQNRDSDGSLLGEYPNRGSNEFGNMKGENSRGGSHRPFKSFDDGNNFQEGNKFGGDGRFDRRSSKMFQNFNSGFPMRNGNESMNSNRFGNFGRPDNGFAPRGIGGLHRERPNLSRGLMDFAGGMPQEIRTPSRQDRFSNRDDRVDEFGRSIQLRNRKNASSEEDSFKEDNKFQGNQQNFSGFGNRFASGQQNQRPPPLLRGRESWPSSDSFQERRGFRTSFDEQNRFRPNKVREQYGKFKEDIEQSKSFKKDCCVEIQNLSPHIAYGEVRRPFSNLKLIIKEIKFFDYSLNDKKCRIRFLNYESKKKALQMSSKLQIDHKQVHLIEIKDSEFDECVDEGVKRPEVKFSDDEDDVSLSSKDAYIQVRDLSLNIEESDIVKLFPNAALDKIILEVSADGKSKCAFLKFQKAVDAKVALGTPNRSIGDCIVFLTPLPQYVFNDYLNKSSRENPGEQDDVDIVEVESPCPVEESLSDKDRSPSTCVLMKNLPLEATDRDICDFFSDIGLVPNKIHLMLDVNGQPSGDAFCEFSTSGQIERACTKNSAHLGKNIVTVCQVTRNEMLEALGLLPNEINQELQSLANPEDTFGRPQCVVALENIPFRAGVLDIINFFGWSYKLTENDVLRRYNDRGQPTGDGRVCFKTPEDALRAIRFLNNRNLMGRVIRMKLL